MAENSSRQSRVSKSIRHSLKEEDASHNGSQRRKTSQKGQQQQQHQQSKDRHHHATGSHSGQHDSRSSGANMQSSAPIVAPITGQIRSGHIEVDTLYGSGTPGSSGSGQLVVNAMNAPNNSTMQCGCENIDCPFCNLMLSVQMKQGI